MFVFALSITQQIARHYPATFPQVPIYAVLLCISLGLIGLIAATKDPKRLARLCGAIRVGVWLLVGLWCLLAPLTVLGAEDAVAMPTVVFMVFDGARLLFTALLFLLWNVPLALGDVREAPGLAALVVLFAAFLFALASLLGLVGTLVAAAVATVTSCVLEAFVGRRFSFNEASPYSAASCRTAQSAEPKPERHLGRLRCTFFLSRILWYTLATVFTIITASRAAAIVENPAALLLGLPQLVVVGAAIVLAFPSKPAAFFAVASVPVAIGCAYIAGYGAAGTATLSLMLVVVVVFSRHLLFYMQLPSYRNLTGMDPIRYALFERLVPVALTYLLRLVLALMVAGPLGRNPLADVPLDLVPPFAVTSIALFVVVAGRHILRYYPEVSVGRLRMVGTPASAEPVLSGQQHNPAREEKVLDAVARESGLTSRETDVLHYLAQGYSKPYIAKALCVSLATVKTHTNRIYSKLGISTRDELIERVTTHVK